MSGGATAGAAAAVPTATDLMLTEGVILLAVGTLFVIVFRRFGLGAVLGYLCAGALVGPFGLGLVGDETAAGSDSNVAAITPNAPWHRPSSDRPRREPRPHVASAEELERHKAFIAGIDNAIWTR